MSSEADPNLLGAATVVTISGQATISIAPTVIENGSTGVVLRIRALRTALDDLSAWSWTVSVITPTTRSRFYIQRPGAIPRATWEALACGELIHILVRGDNGDSDDDDHVNLAASAYITIVCETATLSIGIPADEDGGMRIETGVSLPAAQFLEGLTHALASADEHGLVFAEEANTAE